MLQETAGTAYNANTTVLLMGSESKRSPSTPGAARSARSGSTAPLYARADSGWLRSTTAQTAQAVPARMSRFARPRACLLPPSDDRRQDGRWVVSVGAQRPAWALVWHQMSSLINSPEHCHCSSWYVGHCAQRGVLCYQYHSSVGFGTLCAQFGMRCLQRLDLPLEGATPLGELGLAQHFQPALPGEQIACNGV